MTNPTYERLAYEIARKAAEEMSDNGLPVFPPDGGDQDDIERERWLMVLKIAKMSVNHIAKALEMVTPEMIYAWEMAPIPAGVAAMTDQEANSAVAQSNWSAMLAVSALHPADKEYTK